MGGTWNGSGVWRAKGLRRKYVSGLYGGCVRWVRCRVEGCGGYGGYGGGVLWVRWAGTTVGTVEGMGNVDGHSAYSGGSGVRGEGGCTVQGRRGRYT